MKNQSEACGANKSVTTYRLNLPFKTAVLASTIATCGFVHAQASSGTYLDEIVVTAQKRAENMQDVPLAVSAVDAKALSAMGVSGTEDLNVAVPGLNFTNGVGSGLPFIRGVGTSDTSPGNENAISIYVDGVYIPSSTAGIFDFNNIDRIEVLRGPQGTLFGRNASGGIIHVITKDPDLVDSHLDVTVGYGNFSTFTGNLYGSTPLGDSVAVDLAMTYSDQGDGYGEKIQTGDDIFEGSSLGIRSKLLWELSDDTTVTLSGSYNEDDSSFGFGYQVVDTPTPGVDYWDVEGDPGAYWNDSESKLTSLKIEHDLGDLVFTSITAYQDNEADYSTDADATPLPIINARIVTSEKVFTQELQLASRGESPLSWTAGLYYFTSEADLHRDLTGLAAGGPDSVLQNNGIQDTDSYAAYGQLAYDLTDRLALTAGLRYTKDERSYDSNWILADGTVLTQPPGYENEDDASEPTWRLALDYQMNEDTMVYASYSRGFKSGVYVTSELAAPPTDPEILDAYEIGSKMTVFDGNGRLNLAAYYYDYKDMQVQFVDDFGSQLLSNAGESEIMGVEAEFDYAPTENLTLRTSISSTIKAEYTDFDNAPSPTTGGVFDASGFDVVRNPDYTVSVGGDYDIYTESGVINLAANYYYNDGWYPEIDNVLRVDSYSLFNASATWTSLDEKFKVQLWGKNLTDEEYESDLVTLVFPIYIPANPRTFGVKFSYSY